MLRGILHVLGIVGIITISGTALFAVTQQKTNELHVTSLRPNSPSPSLQESLSATTSPSAATTSPKVPEPIVTKSIIRDTIEPKTPTTQSPPLRESPPPENQALRIENPYEIPQKTADTLNNEVRAALVNIYCETMGGPLNSISGSGIIIDQRGVILTNAHVAQYVLLSSQPEIGLSCSIRAGSPAVAKWKADMLYMPAPWIQEHATDIKKSRPKGTGEDDYALLLITGTTNASPLPTSFPFLHIDTQEAIGFTGDSVLLAGFPAEFSGGSATRSSLYPSSVMSKIGDLLTFNERSVDVISVGSVVLAQSGSSGGAVVNLWGRLIGVISTTSEGATTADRELRAITLSYINRDIRSEEGISLINLLEEDVTARSSAYMKADAPALARQIIAEIQSR